MCLKDVEGRPTQQTEHTEGNGTTNDGSDLKIEVPAASGNNGPQIHLRVWDLSSAATSMSKLSVFVPVSSNVSELMAQVGRTFKYDPETFSLIQQQSNGNQVTVNKLEGDTPVSSLGFSQAPNARNNLVLMDLSKNPPVQRSDDDDLSLGASASPTFSSSNRIWYDPRTSSSSSSNYEDGSDYNYSSSLIRHDTGYVGLVNQAMTCYLNSLLQTLFMTPEFRNALYRWEFRGTEEEAVKSIPFQLQKLFLQLQITSRNAVETTSLTRSFGWDSSEAWQQHDIQELCRVMFDALEQCFRNTDQADLINNLYEGKMKDYVKCLQCGTESAREDTFLDIPLPIRPFGRTTAFKSVEEALQEFVTPELLTENNKYKCSKCNSLCEAHKGLKFTRFPYLLTIHLKRFDFDYQSLHRIKLNDRVTFPNILDLNPFLENGSKEDSASAATPDKSASDKPDDASTSDSGSALDADEVSNSDVATSVSHQGSDTQDEDEGIDVSSIYNEKNKACLSSGPHVYELFSIMVHSGSASGGHYYAYIKDFKLGEWYCFNDQSVTRITCEDVQKTYGGTNSRGYYSSWSSSANAYMLMYRQLDKERNADFFQKEDFPEHIKKLVERMIDEEAAEKEAKEMERSMCKIKLFYENPKTGTMVEKKLKVHKDSTLLEATKLAHKELGIENVVPIERCRLVKYEEFHDSIECSFEGQENNPISEILGGVRISYKFDLLLEVRDEDKEFEVYKPGGITLKVYMINLDTEEVEGPRNVRASQTMTVQELKECLGRKFDMDPSKMRILVDRYFNDVRPLACDKRTLQKEEFSRSNKIYIEASGKEPPNFFVGSVMYSIHDRYEHTITVYCSLPDNSKAVLEELQIPPYDEDSSRQSEEVVGRLDVAPADSITSEQALEEPLKEKVALPGVSVSPAVKEEQESKSALEAPAVLCMALPPNEPSPETVGKGEAGTVSQKIEVTPSPLKPTKSKIKSVTKSGKSPKHQSASASSSVEIGPKSVELSTQTSTSQPGVNPCTDSELECVGDSSKDTVVCCKSVTVEKGESDACCESSTCQVVCTSEQTIETTSVKSSTKLRSVKVSSKSSAVKKCAVNSQLATSKHSASSEVVTSCSAPVQTASTSLSSQTAITSLSLQTALTSLSSQTALTSLSSQTALMSLSSQTALTSLSSQTALTSLSSQTALTSLSSQTALTSLSSQTALTSLSSQTASPSCSPSQTASTSCSPSLTASPAQIAPYNLKAVTKQDSNLDAEAAELVADETPARSSPNMCKEQQLPFADVKEPSGERPKQDASVRSKSCKVEKSKPAVKSTRRSKEEHPDAGCDGGSENGKSSVEVPGEVSLPSSTTASLTTVTAASVATSSSSQSHLLMSVTSPSPVLVTSELVHTEGHFKVSGAGSVPSARSDSDVEDEGIVDADLMGSSALNSDQSASEDSSLTSDSDRTLVGEPPEDKLSDISNSSEHQNVSSPEENGKERWGLPLRQYESIWPDDDEERPIKRYFRAHMYDEKERLLQVSVDKRITVAQLKKELVKWVKVSDEHFKVFKHYSSSNQEFELRPTETLSACSENTLSVRLGRALLPGEYKGKFYLLDPNNNDEPATFLIDYVICQGDTVGKVKQGVVREVNARCTMTLEADRLRLRKKSWKNPQVIYLDSNVFATDINVYSNWEMYLQVLDGPEQKTSSGEELFIFAKRWRPSTYMTDPLVEVMVTSLTCAALKEKLSEISGIPADDVEFAKGRATFPCDMSVLDISTDLDWTQRSGALDQRPLYIMEDGSVIYYRDRRESLRELSDSERSKLSMDENARLNKDLQYSSPSVSASSVNIRRYKERGLKIYLNQSNN